MEDAATEYIFKLKGKHKDNDYTLLTLSVFIAGLQSLFNLVEEITTSATPVNDGAAQPQAIDKRDKDAGISSDADYASSSNAIPFLLWSDSLFNQTDYDSTMERGDVPLIMDEDDKLNVFQS
jgi:hypothetical protein